MNNSRERKSFFTAEIKKDGLQIASNFYEFKIEQEIDNCSSFLNNSEIHNLRDQSTIINNDSSFLKHLSGPITNSSSIITNKKVKLRVKEKRDDKKETDNKNKKTKSTIDYIIDELTSVAYKHFCGVMFPTLVYTFVPYPDWKLKMAIFCLYFVKLMNNLFLMFFIKGNKKKWQILLHTTGIFENAFICFVAWGAEIEQVSQFTIKAKIFFMGEILGRIVPFFYIALLLANFLSVCLFTWRGANRQLVVDIFFEWLGKLMSFMVIISIFWHYSANIVVLMVFGWIYVGCFIILLISVG